MALLFKLNINRFNRIRERGKTVSKANEKERKKETNKQTNKETKNQRKKENNINAMFHEIRKLIFLLA